MIYQSLRIINRFWRKLPRGVVIDLLTIGSIYSDEAKGIYVVNISITWETIKLAVLWIRIIYGDTRICSTFGSSIYMSLGDVSICNRYCADRRIWLATTVLRFMPLLSAFTKKTIGE